MKGAGLLPEERPGLGVETGFRVLPYAMQDAYDPAPAVRQIECITLENGFLRATFLPGLGGRLYSLWDKAAGRELLFSNPVIKLGNLALRNAWFSGGIEWNFGHLGHTYFTCEDVFFARCEGEGGPFLRMYVYERVKRLTFQADFHLPEGAHHLTAHMRVTNPNPAPAPIYLWTNAAVPEEAGVRVFSGTEEVILLGPSGAPGESGFVHARLPHPLKDGLDHSYPASVPHAEEYFFQNLADDDHAFESVVYPDGRMTYERSTGNYPYRKMFCWGGHKGGKRWQDHLSRPGEGAYIEIQSGFFRTQQHTGFIGAGETWSLTQMFGGCRSDSSAFSVEYARARENMQSLMAALLPARALEQEHARCLGLALAPARELLHQGTGWGALERLRDPQYLPAHLPFPKESMDKEQAPWAALLQGEPFPGAGSFMTAPEWLPVMEKALKAQPGSASLLTHYGIALYENGDFEAAKAAWKEALSSLEEPLALRNLSAAASREGDRVTALAYMERAVGALPKPEMACAEEYLKLLTGAGLYGKAWAFYRSLPESLQQGERLSVTASASALELGEEAFLDRQFARTFSVIREGETALLDLWFRREAMREAKRRGVALTDALIEEVRQTAKPPENLDFRMLS